jgi:VanZ family protein
MKPNKWLIAPVGFMALIMYLCLLPGSDLPKINWFNFIGNDKLIHFGIYAMLVLLWGFFFYKSNIDFQVNLLTKIVAFSGAYGLLIEIMQGAFTQRHFDWYDALANTIGALIGAACLYYYQHKTPKKEQQ